MRYGDVLAAAGILPSIGSVGDSSDNALAESTIGLVKTDLVHNPTRSPWSRLSSFEFALAEYIDWSTTPASTASSTTAPPIETETDHYRHHTPSPLARIHPAPSTEPTAVQEISPRSTSSS